MAEINQVIKRSGAVVPFTQERITNAIYRAAVAVGGRDRSVAEKLTEQVIRLLEEAHPSGSTPTVEEIQDAVEKALIENGHARVAKAYILYRDERARLRKQAAERALQPSSFIPWARIWRVLDWAVSNQVHTVRALNERIARGEFSQVIAKSEEAYHQDIQNAVELISRRVHELRMVIICGPSSSGKTTTTIKVGQHLKEMGLKLVTLNVDHYFFDLELHPKDEFGDYDFETPQALDLALINEHLVKLFAGEEVMIPYYNFRTGTRTPAQTPMRLAEDEIILIDSLHGFFPDMTGDIPVQQKFMLYLEPLLQMKDDAGEYVRWTDLRLIRRMLRDAAHRAYSPTKTLEHWHYVRSSELRNIIPYINSADYIVNSGMPSELPLYAARLLGDFGKWAEQYRRDPLRQDAGERAERIYKLLQSITPVSDESLIPADSVLREFIGGSCYEY